LGRLELIGREVEVPSAVTPSPSRGTDGAISGGISKLLLLIH